MSQYEQLIQHLHEEDTKKVWTRTCCKCGHKEVFTEHPSEKCVVCGEELMMIRREIL